MQRVLPLVLNYSVAKASEWVVKMNSNYCRKTMSLINRGAIYVAVCGIKPCRQKSIYQSVAMCAKSTMQTDNLPICCVLERYPLKLLTVTTALRYGVKTNGWGKLINQSGVFHSTEPKFTIRDHTSEDMSGFKANVSILYIN